MLKKTPALASHGVSLLHIPLLANSETSACIHSIPVRVKVADKGFHNTPIPPHAPKLLKGALFKQEVQYVFGK